MTMDLTNYSDVATSLTHTLILLNEARANAESAVKAVEKCIGTLASGDTDDQKRSKIISYDEALQYSLSELIAVIESLTANYETSSVVPKFTQNIICDILEVKTGIEISRTTMALPVSQLLELSLKSYMDTYFDGKRDTGEFMNPGIFVPFTEYLIDGINTIGDLAYWIYSDSEYIHETIIEDTNDEDGYETAFKTMCGALDIICHTHFFTEYVFGE